jgi:hypothetical protein
VLVSLWDHILACRHGGQGAPSQLLATGPWEVFVEPKGPEEGQLRKAPMTAVPQDKRAVFAWPWGLVAIGVMALAWVGIYLLWNGVVFLFNW